MKYYVIRRGRQAGIYHSWPEAQAQIESYPGAQYKSFPTLESAQLAYEHALIPHKGKYDQAHLQILMGEDFFTSIATDAACPSNPGPIEYRGVTIDSTKEIFSRGPLAGGSTNIAEFLAIVQGIVWLYEHDGHYTTLYSDSTIALKRVEHNKLNTSIQVNASNQQLWQLIEKAQNRLTRHPDWKEKVRLKKRPTQERGQIPADFGRK